MMLLSKVRSQSINHLVAKWFFWTVETAQPGYTEEDNPTIGSEVSVSLTKLKRLLSSLKIKRFSHSNV